MSKYIVVKSYDGSSTLFSYNDDNLDGASVTSTGLELYDGVPWQPWTYSGSDTFMGFATVSNALSVEYDAGDNLPFAGTGTLTLYAIGSDNLPKTYKKMTLPDGTKLQVESAIRDGNGLKIDTGYVKTDKIVTSFQSTPDDTHVASEKLVKDELDKKQVTLVGSGTGQNIKTINNATLLGSGNISLQTPLTAGVDYQTPITIDDNLNTTSTNPVQNKAIGLLTTTGGSLGSVNTSTSGNEIALKGFVNSSINALAAYYITKNAAGDPFATHAELLASTTVYSGGAVRVPTRNDYCVVLADETNGDGDSTRYTYNSDSSTYSSSNWAYQYTFNKQFTEAQMDALDSGITSDLVSKLNGIASGAEVNVQSDWDETNTSSDAYIKNKPTIPTVNNSTITIQKNGTTVDSFTLNASSGKTINITVPTTASDVSALPSNTTFATINGTSVKSNTAFGLVDTSTNQDIGGNKTFTGTTKVNQILSFSNTSNPYLQMYYGSTAYYVQTYDGKLGIGPGWSTSTTVDSTGQVVFPSGKTPKVGTTAVALVTDLSDTKVTQTADSSTNSSIPILLKNVSTSGTAGTTLYNTGVTVNPSTGTLTATTLSGNLAYSNITSNPISATDVSITESD